MVPTVVFRTRPALPSVFLFFNSLYPELSSLWDPQDSGQSGRETVLPETPDFVFSFAKKVSNFAEQFQHAALNKSLEIHPRATSTLASRGHEVAST